jgi:parallel beta-helix repeat protein
MKNIYKNRITKNATDWQRFFVMFVLAIFLVAGTSFNTQAQTTVKGDDVCFGIGNETVISLVKADLNENYHLLRTTDDGTSYTWVTYVNGQDKEIEFATQTVVGKYKVWKYTTDPVTKTPATIIANGQEQTGEVEIFANPVPTIAGDIDVCSDSEKTYTTEYGMDSYNWSVSGGTGSSTSNSITVTWGSAGAGSVSVNYTDGNGCTADNATVFNVTKTDAPSVSDVSLKSTINQTNYQDLSGSHAAGYSMYLYGCAEYTYLDVNSLTATVDIKENFLHPFYLKQTGLTQVWWDYWTAKGVADGATGWQGVMYDIISGNEPVFYLKKTGNTYSLIDGLQYQVGDGEQMLRISGDYPLGTYTYDGELYATDDCFATLSIDMTFERGVLNASQQKTYGTIQDAVTAAIANDVINVCSGIYVESGQIVIDKKLTIEGTDKATTIIKPAQNTGSAGNARGWFLVTDGTEFNLSDVTLDGEGKQIHQAIRSLGSGTINNNIIKNIHYSQYIGLGVVVMGNYDMTISNNTFSDIERIGMMAFGTGVTNSQFLGNTYTGKGSGDHLDYGIEVGGGAEATIIGNTFTNCGQSSTAWSSAGVLVNSHYSPNGPATAKLEQNVFDNNYIDLFIGYDENDLSVVTANNNSFTNTAHRHITSVGSNVVEATCNWYGTVEYKDIYSKINGTVVFVPHLLTSDLNGTCSGGPAIPLNLALTYTEGNEGIKVEFDVTANELELQPITGLDPMDETDLAQIVALYQALGVAIANNDQAAIQAAALAVGDDILTEYYYMDGTTKVYLKTINSNDLVKNKYWNQYLVGSEPANNRFPDWANDITLIPQDNYRTHTNPLTLSVAEGWLNPVLGRNLYVTVTFVNNGYVNTITESVAIAQGPVNVYSAEPFGPANWVSSHVTIQDAISAETTLAGHFISVDAGTYEEQLNITKPVTLLGPNHDKTGYASDRVDEAIIQYPAGLANGSYYLATVDAENVNIKGFTFNDNVSGGFTYDGTWPPPMLVGGVRSNESNTLVENNRFSGFNNIAVRMTQSNASNSQTTNAKVNNRTRYNYFEGGAVYHAIYYQASSGVIEHNRLVNVSAGVQIQPYFTNAAGTVNNNEISMYSSGLYYNYANWTIDENTLWSFTSNTITAPSAAPVWNKLTWNALARNFDGIRVETYLQDNASTPKIYEPKATFTSNTINGDNASIAGGWLAVNGAYFRNVKGVVATNLTNITFTNNTYTNVEVGVQFDQGTDVKYELSALYVNGNSYPTGMGIIEPYQIAFCGGGLITNITRGTAFCNIQAAIDAASTLPGDVIQIEEADYTEPGQVVISKNLTLQGKGKTTTTLRPGINTENTGDARGFILVQNGIDFTLKDLTIDGSTRLVWQAVRNTGSGKVENVRFTEIKYNPSTNYAGTAIAAFGNGNGNVDVYNCEFDEIGRIGVHYFGTGITNSTYSGNTYTGKGEGDWIDNALDIGAGAKVNVINNTISGNTGVASSDGSTSAGILASTHYGSGTEATIENNFIFDNTTGIYVGFDASDASLVTANNNSITANDYGLISTNAAVNATCNWWGVTDGNTIAAMVSGSVNYDPWLVNGTDNSTDPGFQPVLGSCEGSPVIIDLVETTADNCDGPAGTIEVTFSGGTAPYSIEWDGTQVTVSSPYIITGLVGGSYDITVTDDNGSSDTELAVTVEFLPVKNNDLTEYYATIGEAITAAAGGHTLELCAGNYTESVTINKDLTINGPNAGIDPNGVTPRFDEAVILDGKINILGTNTIVLDGIKIHQTTDVTAISLGGATKATIQNVIIERFGVNAGIQTARGIEISNGTGIKNINKNLFTGDVSGGLYSGHKTWNSGIFLNGSASVINLTDNVFENCRTALNIDDMGANIALSGNIFKNSGTYISFGGTTPTTGSYTFGANEYNAAVGTIFNLSNVDPTFRLDVSASTYGGVVFSSLTLNTLFEVSARTAHMGRPKTSAPYVSNGLVTFVPNNLYAVNIPSIPFADDINVAIGLATTGNIINLQDGTYNQRVVLNKSLTLNGQSEDGAVIDGAGLAGTGSGITINNGITGVTIKDLTVQNFAGNGPNQYAGIYAVGGNNNLSVLNTTLQNNIGGSGFYANGSITDVILDYVTASGHDNSKGAARGIVIWNGLKSNITITNCEVFNNNCCGIELQDGDATGVLMQNNIVYNNGDNGIGIVGLTGPGENLIKGNDLDNNGRFGIEIKNPNGTGLTTGAGRIVVEDNNVSMTSSISDVRDMAGIAAFRRGVLANNVDIPTGVVIQNNTVSGYSQSSTSDGFGIVVEGINHTITDNILNNNDVGIQQQSGHLPYPGDGDQSNLADEYFGRGNSPFSCGNTFSGNSYTGNSVDFRNVPAALATGGTVTNANTGKIYCSIQGAIDEANINDELLVSAGIFNETVTVNKSLSLLGANAKVNPCSGIRGAESVIQDNDIIIAADNVTINGFEVTGNDAQIRSDVNGSTWSNIDINYNYIHATTAGQPILHGFGSGGGIGTSGWVVTYNKIEDINCNDATAIVLFNITDLNVSNNCISHTETGLTGNQGRRGMNIDGGQTVTIANNTIDMGLTNPVQTTGFPNFYAARYPLQISQSDRPSTGITIENNVLKGAYDGIVTLGNNDVTGLTIQKNTFSHSIYAIRLRAGSNSAGNLQSAINILNNDFSTVSRRSIMFGTADADVFDDILITNNSLTGGGEKEIYVENDQSLVSSIDANCNWWGTVNGDDIAAKVTGDVDISTWLVPDLSGTVNPWWSNDTYSCSGTPVVILAADPTNIYCGEADGSIQVTWQGGSANYSVSWTGPSSGIEPGIIGTSYNIQNLEAGNYTIMVTDANGSSDTFEDVVINYLPVTLQDGSSFVKGYYATIQPAINAAADGDVVEVCAGYYEENLANWKDMEITKSITLKGAGSGQTVIGLSEGKQNGLEIRGANLDVHLEGITFTKRTGAVNGPQRALRIGETASTFNSLTMIDVEVTHASLHNVALDGGANIALFNMANCSFTDAGNTGFYSFATIAGGTWSDNIFDLNGTLDDWGGGLHLAGPTSDLTVTGGSMSNNSHVGFAGRRLTNVSFENIVASENNGPAGTPGPKGEQGIGMAINEKTDKSENVTFTNITASNNGFDGYFFTAEAGKTIKDVSINGGTIIGNDRNGIYYWPQGGTVSKITIDGPVISGKQPINLAGQSGNPLTEIKVLNTTATDIAGGGNTIVVDHANDVEYTDNDVSGSNYNALVVLNSSNVLIKDNEANDNIYAGIILVDVTGAEISGNTVYDNSSGTAFEFGGITIFGNCSDVSINNNLLTNNNIGVKIFENSSGISANNNSITGGTFGVKNDAASILDATCNWFGTTVATDVAALVQGNVNYSPWLTDDGNSSTGTGFIPTACDEDAPALTVTGFTADGTVSMAGNLNDGYTLETTNDPSVNHTIQFTAGSVATEDLQTEVVGLFLQPATGQTTELQTYYADKPADYQTYLNNAAAGTEPFAFIKTGGTAIQLLDGAQYSLASQEVDMVVPDDFPLGTYTVSGVITDLAGNETTVTFILIVDGDRVAPEITLNGDDEVFVCQGETYNELGATANDDVDGDISSEIDIDNTEVNTAIPGSYNVYYNVTDAAGNAALEIIRTVTVNALPTAILSGTQSVCANDNEATLNVDFTGEAPWTFYWSDDGGVTTNKVITSNNPHSIIVNPTGNTTYSLVGDVTDGNTCSSAATGEAKIYYGPVTTVPDMVACPGEQIVVPITVESFSDVRDINLVLKYDGSVMSFDHFENGDIPFDDIGGISVSNIQADGDNYRIIISKPSSGLP